jgi:hypothetical protein
MRTSCYTIWRKCMSHKYHPASGLHVTRRRSNTKYVNLRSMDSETKWARYAPGICRGKTEYRVQNRYRTEEVKTLSLDVCMKQSREPRDVNSVGTADDWQWTWRGSRERAILAGQGVTQMFCASTCWFRWYNSNIFYIVCIMSRIWK